MTDHPHDPLRPHAHDPNPEPPSADSGFVLTRPDGTEAMLSVADLQHLPKTVVSDCYIVSTGHGSSGPFEFSGVTLLELIRNQVSGQAWSEVEVVSADGFGNRVLAKELYCLVRVRVKLWPWMQRMVARSGMCR